MRAARLSILVLLIAAATGGAADARPQGADPIGVVRAQMDAYNRLDADAFLAHYDERAMLLDLRSGRATAIGKREFGPLYRDMFANGCMDRFGRACPDLHAEEIASLRLGNFVVMHERITLAAEEAPLDVLLVYEVREGRIYRLWSGWDQGAEGDATLVDAQMNGYNAKDLDAFLAPYSPDVELRLLTTGETLARGTDFLRGAYGPRFEQAPDLRAAPLGRIALADLVASHEQITDGNGNTSESIDLYLLGEDGIRLVWFLIPDR